MIRNRYTSILLTLCLLVGLFIVRTEIASVLVAREGKEVLTSAQGFAAAVSYGFLALAGLISLTIRFWNSSFFQRSLLSVPDWLRWMAVFGLLLIVLWDYLFSPWRSILGGKWTQLVFAIGFVQVISLILSSRRDTFPRLSETAMVAALFVFPRMVVEVRQITDSSFASRGMTVLSFISLIALTVALYHPLGEQLAAWLLSLRKRLGKSRRLFVVLLWLSPIIFHYAVGSETTILYANLRFAILFLAIWITSFLFGEQEDDLITFSSFAINTSVLVLACAVDNYLLIASNYPFSLTWSEGNRFYDYSLVFGQSIYNSSSRIVDPYNTPGRYGLWGILFLWKGSPIWAHRLWNMVLQVVPPLFYAALITKRIRPTVTRQLTMFGIALFFIVLAPLHPPFMLGSVIVVLFAFDRSLVKRALSLLIAASYLAISRWTWVLAPAAMSALLDLFLYYPHRSGNWFKRLLPTAAFALLGVIPGLYVNFATFTSAFQGDLTAVKQPLLWYRLLPNGTLAPGVLLLVLLYTGPLLAVLAWWMYRGEWRLDIWQKLGVWGILAAFFGTGLVISTKIGGGGDLHNLDMYLVTLMLVVALGLTERSERIENMQLPVWTVSLYLLLMLFSIYQRTPITIDQSRGADSAMVQDVLSTLRTRVETASQSGEVLFMDQRQLLTFGYVPAIPFIQEYEKKFMMDKAMANDASYFKPYYQDLAKQRFSLIVTEILRTKFKKDMGGPFSEENDAFVTWVSNPTLCFYEPVYISKETNIMLLVPKADPQGCDEYLK